MSALVMKLSFIFVYIFCVPYINGVDFDTYEANQVELTPIHEAIIFNDIANIMNDFEESMNPSLNKDIYSESDSGEDIEELLSEYQHYLDKAHKQRIHYERKTNGKNKVPLIRREKYTKSKDSSRNLISQPQEQTRPLPNIYDLNNEKNMLPNLFPKVSRSKYERIPPSCHCNIDQIPCKCNCKQCFISLPNKNFKNIFIENHPKTARYIQNKVDDNKINIRLKIDVQLPKLTELGWVPNYNQEEKTTEGEWIPSKEVVSSINLPFPFLNFPIPIELLGDSKIYNKHDSSPMRKISIHKKKKSRFSGNSKKHMGKKIITFHSLDLQQPIGANNTDKNNTSNISKNISMNSYNAENKKPLHNLDNTERLKDINSTTAVPLKTLNSSIETIFLTVNISKKPDNDTNDSLKLENSIETDFIYKLNKTTNQSLRVKREAMAKNADIAIGSNTKTTNYLTKQNISTERHTKKSQIHDKTLVSEMELLYWPAAIKNATVNKSKNITALILERENKKVKLNMVYGKTRNNRTKALEQAIFGKVDWNDVDTVAPIFMSFIGKYIRGVLTFCSQSICHSMKCSEKTCLHRTCSPDNRLNHKGHCTGSNDTDSVAVMESIMDLPSNVVFEIVDILQDKMLGKIYGKATLCITSKCSTFVAYKKLFQKSKCVYKKLSSTGHCPIVLY